MGIGLVSLNDTIVKGTVPFLFAEGAGWFSISEIWRIAFQENEKHLRLPFMTGSFSLTLMVTM